MTTTKAPNAMRLDADELKKLIHRSAATIKVAKDDRRLSNADISLAFETMENAGIPRAAAKLALTYQGWDEDARAGFDVAYQFVRDALGVPMEDQLFTADGKPNLKWKAEEDKEPKPRGRPPGPGKKATASTPTGDGNGQKSQGEQIAESVLEEARKSTGQPTLN